MFNFITNLLNINENEVEDLKVVSLPSETQFHITLFPTFPSCSYRQKNLCLLQKQQVSLQ